METRGTQILVRNCSCCTNKFKVAIQWNPASFYWTNTAATSAVLVTLDISLHRSGNIYFADTKKLRSRRCSAQRAENVSREETEHAEHRPPQRGLITPRRLGWMTEKISLILGRKLPNCAQWRTRPESLDLNKLRAIQTKSFRLLNTELNNE